MTWTYIASATTIERAHDGGIESVSADGTSTFTPSHHVLCGATLTAVTEPVDVAYLASRGGVPNEYGKCQHCHTLVAV
jgi:hypothetical protein